MAEVYLHGGSHSCKEHGGEKVEHRQGTGSGEHKVVEVVLVAVEVVR